MTPAHFSDRTGHLMAMNEDLVRFVTGSTWAERQGSPASVISCLATRRNASTPTS